MARLATSLGTMNSLDEEISLSWVDSIVPPTKDSTVSSSVERGNILKKSIILRLVEQ